MDKPYHHGNLKVAIVAAARSRLRGAIGAALSLRELARETGVSPNAPYRHFPGKGGVTAAVVADGYRELTQISERAIGSPHPSAALVAGYAKFAASESALLRLVNAEDLAEHGPESEVVLARDEWFAGLLGVVEVEAGKLPPDEAYKRAAGIWAALIGITQLRTHGARGLLPEELFPDASKLVGTIARGR